MGVFKAYDVRGIWNQDWNRDTAYRIGYFLPGLLGADRVLVGRDMRLSSPEVFESLTRGILDAGVDVVDLGLTTTPMVYWFTSQLKAEASVMITASHNPPEYNGLKISRGRSLPVGYETGLRELEALVRASEADRKRISPALAKGQISTYEGRAEYLAYLRPRRPSLSGLKLGVDCSNGMGGLLARDLFGSQAHYLYETLDGTFPGHDPNPLEEENCAALQALVRAEGLDAGLIFDGDADRVMFIDETGRFVSPDRIIGVLAKHYLRQGPCTVLHDIRTTRAVPRYVAAQGGRTVMWKVGHAFAKLKMAEVGAVVGGELAGHYYFQEFYNCDSAYLAALTVLDELQRARAQGLTFSQLLAEIGDLPNSGERNFTIEDKAGAMRALVAAAQELNPTALYDFDGYRVEYKDWWFNVRPSNTEPYLRLVVEADSPGLLKEKLAWLEGLLRPF